MTTTRFRAVATLTPKEGRQRALIEFTLSALPEIRRVDGLVDVEVCRSIDPPGRLFLYYWWTSPERSADYMSGPVYAKLGPALADLVDEHVLILGELQTVDAAG